MKSLTRMKEDFWQDRRQLTICILLLPIGPLMILLQPYILKVVIDGPFAEKNWPEVVRYGFLFLGLAVVDYLARSAVLAGFQTLGQRGLMRLRLRVVQHILNQGASYFDKTPLGVLITRITSDIETISDLFSTGVITIILDTLFIIGLLIVLFLMNPNLAASFLVIVPVCVLALNFFRRKLKYWFDEQRSQLAKVNASLEENLRGFEVIQTHQSQKTFFDRFIEIHRRYRDSTFKNNLYDAFLFGSIETLLTIALAWLLWRGIGLYQTQVGTPLTLGVLVAFIDYAQKLFGPIKEFSGKMAIIQRCTVSLDRIHEILETKPTVAAGTKKLPSPSSPFESRGFIEANSVSFRYQPQSSYALLNVSFSIQPGELVALVGDSGAGKTTITRLLTRSYDGYEGSLKLNGIEIRELEIRNVRSQVATIQQDPVVFSNTVFENIRLFKPHISEQQVMDALDRVKALGWINQLPKGVQSTIGPQGIQLSSGQVQILQLARLFVFPAQVLILDEATSQVDSESEALIQQALEQVYRSFTTIVVAHRLSTIMKADRIFVFQKGRIVEQGTHPELLKAKGRYHSLQETGLLQSHHFTTDPNESILKS